MFYQIFFSPQVNYYLLLLLLLCAIITYKHGVYELPHELPNDLKVQSCKLHNNKYMIASIQITNTEIFAFIAVLVFELLSRKVLFINRKDNRNC